MRQQFAQQCDSHLQITERVVAIPSHPFDPPSSPPPTSPLPPLPEIKAQNDYGSPVSKIFPVCPVSTSGHPIRPPRPRTLLPNVKPRTITSPEPGEYQRRPVLLAQERLSPTPSERVDNPPESNSRHPDEPRQHWTFRSPRPTYRPNPRFPGDVLGALPKFSNASSTTPAAHGEPAGDDEQTKSGNRSQIFHERRKILNNGVADGGRVTKRPVARSALFIPKTPPKEMTQLGSSFSVMRANPEATKEPQQILQGTERDSDRWQTHVRLASPDLQRIGSTRKSHKRSRAVDTFTFNFADCPGPISSSGGDDHLTSLPQLPSDPTLLATAAINQKCLCKYRLPIFTGREDSPEEATSFAALPYTDTLQSAGPVPKTEKDNKVKFTAVHDEDTGEEQGRQLSDEEIRVKSRNRVLWAVATVILVIVATAGILIGIIWKLRSLT